MYRSYGSTNAATGTIRNDFVLMFRDPAAVTAMQAAVTVTEAVATGCPGHPDHTVARVALGGRFFGGAVSTPSGEVRDMVAFITRVSDATDPSDVFRVQSVVFHCANQPCTAGRTLHTRDWGSVTRGEAARLRVQWDHDHHRFIFQRDEQPETFAAYAVPDTEPPTTPAVTQFLAFIRSPEGERVIRANGAIPVK